MIHRLTTLFLIATAVGCNDSDTGAGGKPQTEPPLDPTQALTRCLADIVLVEKAATAATIKTSALPMITDLAEVPRTDPWGSAFLIRSTGKNLAFEVVALGPDRALDTRDDVRKPSPVFAPSAETVPQPTADPNGAAGQQPGEKEPPNESPVYSGVSGTEADIDGTCIVAVDADTGDIGYVVLSAAPLAAADMVTARAGVGAVLSAFRPRLDWHGQALDALVAGSTPDEVVATLTGTGQHSTRHLMVYDTKGRGASFVGKQARLTGLSDNVFATDHAVASSRHRMIKGAEDISGDYAKLDATLPLPERLLLGIAVADQQRVLKKPLRSAALRIERSGANPRAHSDTLLDLRVEYHGAPYQRLIELYKIALKAQVAPRLRAQQRRGPGDSEARHQANLRWLRRIRQGKVF